MKKYFSLLAMVFAVCLFTACSDDDDDKKVEEPVSALVGTWDVTESTQTDEGSYQGAFKMTWDVPEGTALNIDMGFGQPIPMDINEVITPLANSFANMYLPQVLKSVTFNADGTITALYKELPDDALSTRATQNLGWKTANGYATYKIVNDNLITLYLNPNKMMEDADDEDKVLIQGVLTKFNDGIPVNVRWDETNTKAYFFVDKAFVQPILVSLNTILSNIPTSDMDDDDIATLKLLKSVAEQLPGIMDKTNTFEAGLELVKQQTNA